MNTLELEILLNCIETMSHKDSFLSMHQYLQHGKTDCLLHSISVAYYSYTIAKRLNLKLDQRSLINGALLHDFFLYDWHKPDSSRKLHGFTHPKTALENAVCEWELSEKETDIILKHMFPLLPALPRYKESILVCLVDKICSAAETLYFPPGKTVKHLYNDVISNSAKGVCNGKDDERKHTERSGKSGSDLSGQQSGR